MSLLPTPPRKRLHRPARQSGSSFHPAPASFASESRLVNPLVKQRTAKMLPIRESIARSAVRGGNHGLRPQTRSGRGSAAGPEMWTRIAALNPHPYSLLHSLVLQSFLLQSFLLQSLLLQSLLFQSLLFQSGLSGTLRSQFSSKRSASIATLEETDPAQVQPGAQS